MTTLQENNWIDICALSDIPPNTGVCADLNGEQVAIFHLKTSGSSDSQVKAVSNFDPFSRANILSRGLITETQESHFVASPLLKQQFCLSTGQCELDESKNIVTYSVRIAGDLVQLQNT